MDGKAAPQNKSNDNAEISSDQNDPNFGESESRSECINLNSLGQGSVQFKVKEHTKLRTVAKSYCGVTLPMVQNINEDDASISKGAETDIVAEFTSLMKKFANLKCIREYIKGKDILYYNKLGMKETAVFVSVMTQQLDSTTCVLIMCETKEMLVEIKNAFNLLASEEVNHSDEKDIFIGTANQILDLNSRGELTFNTNEVKFIFVECDKILLDIKHSRDIQNILKKQKERSLVVFSDVKDQCHIRNFFMKWFDKSVELFDEYILNGFKQYYVVLDENDKIQKLNEILDINIPRRPMILVYVDPDTAELLKDRLCKREEISTEEDFDGNSFCDGKRVLITTYAKVGGLKDIQKVKFGLVINYHMCMDADEYLERLLSIGTQTGAKVISFVEKTNDVIVNDIKSHLGANLIQLSDPSAIVTFTERIMFYIGSLYCSIVSIFN